jgi:hypothetical protein
MVSLAQTYRSLAKDTHFLISLGFSFLLIAASMVIGQYATMYAVESSSNPVTDIVLSNTPVFDVHIIFVYGPILFWIILGLVVVWHPRKVPYILKSIALFVIIRSLFISLTHLGPYPDRVVEDAMQSGLVTFFLNHEDFFLWSTGGDLFFSAHTGLPFLMALIFWHMKRVRIFCIVAALLFGIIVLLGHLHYSIDVLAAFFITYGIFHISEKVFAEDRRKFLKENV